MTEGQDFVILEQYCDPYYANIIRGLLETNGLECLLFDDGHAQNAWYIQSMLGVRIMVRQNDLETARRLIADIAQTPLPLPEGENAPHAAAEKIGFPKTLLAILMSFLTGSFFLFPKKRRR